jgi:hypothetical protein
MSAMTNEKNEDVFDQSVSHKRAVITALIGAATLVVLVVWMTQPAKHSVPSSLRDSSKVLKGLNIDLMSIECRKIDQNLSGAELKSSFCSVLSNQKAVLCINDWRLKDGNKVTIRNVVEAGTNGPICLPGVTK